MTGRQVEDYLQDILDAIAAIEQFTSNGHDHRFGQKNLDYASQAPLHPGYTGCGPNDDHGRAFLC